MQKNHETWWHLTKDIAYTITGFATTVAWGYVPNAVNVAFNGASSSPTLVATTTILQTAGLTTMALFPRLITVGNFDNRDRLILSGSAIAAAGGIGLMLANGWMAPPNDTNMILRGDVLLQHSNEISMPTLADPEPCLVVESNGVRYDCDIKPAQHMRPPSP